MAAVVGVPGLRRWAPFTFFKAGTQFAAPTGDIGTANIDFTSGATYSATNVTPSTQDGRIGALEVLAGFTPGSTSDASVTGLLGSATNTRNALDARYVNETDAASLVTSLVTNAGATRDALDARYVNETDAAGMVTTAGSFQTALDNRFAPQGGGKPVGKGELRINVKDYEGVGNGIADDTTPVTNAVSAGATFGFEVFFPGTYKVSGSIPYLHTVRTVGPGSIVQAGNTFYVQPSPSQTNRIYVSTTGNDSNDGLTASTPKLTFQSCFDALKSYGPVLQGIWEIIAAAGTWTMGSGQQTLSMRSTNRVIVRGPAVGSGVPTAIIDGAGGADYSHGLSASGVGVRVEFRDLKLINFNGSPGFTRIACLGENESDFLATNVHVNGASWAGIYAFNTVRARVYGDFIIENCRDGVAINDTDATVGQSGKNGVIKNCTEFGVYWSRGTQGHIDYVKLEDNATAVMLDGNSRVDLVGNNFKRNNIAIYTRTGGVYNEGGAANVFNDGTADANVTNFNFLAFSGNGDELGASRAWTSPAYDRVLRTVTGTTSLTALNASLWTVPTRRLQGAGKQLRIHAFGIHSVTANSVYTVTVGGMSLALTVPGAATNLTFEIDAYLIEVAGGYRMFGKISQGLSAFRWGQASTGFINSVDSTVGISVTPMNTADTTSVYNTNIYIMG